MLFTYSFTHLSNLNVCKLRWVVGTNKREKIITQKSLWSMSKAHDKKLRAVLRNFDQQLIFLIFSSQFSIEIESLTLDSHYIVDIAKVSIKLKAILHSFLWLKKNGGAANFFRWNFYHNLSHYSLSSIGGILPSWMLNNA